MRHCSEDLFHAADIIPKPPWPAASASDLELLTDSTFAGPLPASDDATVAERLKRQRPVPSGDICVLLGYGKVPEAIHKPIPEGKTH